MHTRQAEVHFQSLLVPAADPASAETVRQRLQGSIHYAGNAWFIRYEEQDGEGTNPIRVVWKVEPSKATLLRTGEISMRQEFMLGTEKTGVYETPYGELQMVVSTNRLDWTVSEHPCSVRLDLAYELDFAGEQSEVSVQVEAHWTD